MHENCTWIRPKIDVGKRHAKRTQNDTEMEPKWEPKTLTNQKNVKKYLSKNKMKFVIKKGAGHASTPGPTPPPPPPLSSLRSG